jgi:sulfate permease, SulP family
MTAGQARGDHPSPFFRGLLPLDRSRLPGDIVAGITLAALGIPEVMGYSRIAGTPVVMGLYTLLLPVAVFAVMGASRHLVVAADSATAAILAAMLVGIAAIGTPEYVGLTSLVALVVAGMLVLARVFKLGFLADFLSRSALVGFLTGVGIQVAGGELAGLVGLAKEGHGTIAQVASLFERLPAVHAATLVVSASVLAVILGCERFAPKVPGALLAVIGAIGASIALDLSARGITTVGTVPGGLPSLALPDLRVKDFFGVVACAASCFIVIVAQSAATARAYALRYQERFAENYDLVGLAGANAAAALTGTFVVNGSPTKTEMVDEAGGRSQVAQLTTALVVVLVLLFLTRPLGFLPNAVLSAIVFLIGVRLVDLKGMRELWHLQRNEFWIAVATAATVVGFTVIDGIVVAVVLSLVEQVRHTYRPHRYVMVRADDGHWQAIAPTADRLEPPGILVYRFEANLFYANSSLFMEEILRLVSEGRGRVKGVVLDASGIDDVDYSAARMLQQVHDELAKRGIATGVVAVNEELRTQMRRYGFGARTDGRGIYPALDAAIAGLGSGTLGATPGGSRRS